MAGSELPFKIAFVAMFAATVVAAVRTARRAAARHGGSRNQLQHEVRGLVGIRAVLGLVFYAMLFTWLLRPHAPQWSVVPLRAGVRWTALVLAIPAVIWCAWSFASIGANYHAGIGLHADHELVTTGAYRRVRHPIYLAFIVLMAVGALLTANWVVAVSGLTLVVLIAVRRIPVEERALAARFFGDWERYAATTGRLLPRLER